MDLIKDYNALKCSWVELKYQTGFNPSAEQTHLVKEIYDFLHTETPEQEFQCGLSRRYGKTKILTHFSIYNAFFRKDYAHTIFLNTHRFAVNNNVREITSWLDANGYKYRIVKDTCMTNIWINEERLLTIINANDLSNAATYLRGINCPIDVTDIFADDVEQNLIEGARYYFHNIRKIVNLYTTNERRNLST